jgi:hypothetical protein
MPFMPSREWAMPYASATPLAAFLDQSLVGVGGRDGEADDLRVAPLAAGQFLPDVRRRERPGHRVEDQGDGAVFEQGRQRHVLPVLLKDEGPDEVRGLLAGPDVVGRAEVDDVEAEVHQSPPPVAAASP